MEYEGLSRRELQALCKKNKIPANITNVAMVESLKALSFVEGIEEIMQASQSGTAQSSIESPEGKEVTSPRVLEIGGRTTWRRTAAKEPATLQPTTRMRRSTRKNISTDSGVAAVPYTAETPAVVQTTKKPPLTSVCRKMESQFKDCEEEEKKGALVTPAPSGVSTRRRRGVKEDSEVKKEYSTRRSVRLAKKSGVEVPAEVENETSGKDLNMSLKESLDDVVEVSGTSGLDAMSIVEEIPEQTDELEVVSAVKQEMQPGDQIDSVQDVSEVSTEAVDKITVVEKNFEAKDAHEDVVASSIVEEVLVGENELEVEESDLNLVVDALEQEMKIILEPTIEIDASKNMEVNVEGENELLKDFTSEVGQFNGSLDVAAAVEMEVCAKAGIEDQPAAVETIAHEGGDKLADEVYVDTENDVGGKQDVDGSPKLDMEEVEETNDVAVESVEAKGQLPTEGVVESPIVASLTPVKASATKKTMTILSDNKENIGSVSKVSLTKERVKMATKKPTEDLESYSMRKLSFMLKTKLQIANQSLKNEKDNEVRERPALLALPENRMVKETQN